MINRKMILKSLKFAGLYSCISLFVTNIIIFIFQFGITHILVGNILGFVIPLIVGFSGTMTHLLHHEKIEALNRKLEKLAKTDHLTEAYNRRAFLEVFETILKEANTGRQVFSFCLLDIDHFKKVNDTYGHLCGDMVLQEFSRLIQSSIRQQDLLCRFGGEEFCILMPELDAEAALPYLVNIKEKINNYEFHYQNQSFKITVSFGLFCKNPRDQYALDEVIYKTDLTMYSAKNKGRNRIEVYAHPPIRESFQTDFHFELAH